MATAPTGGGISRANLNPRVDGVFKEEVTFSTYNTAINPIEEVDEGHIIVPDNFSPQALDGGIPITNKFLLKFQATDFGLKIHLPQGNEKNLYITFCKKNEEYQDGWEDYTASNLIPVAYFTAFASWAHTFPVAKITSLEGSLVTTLRFKSSGRQSTGMDTGLTFKVKLKYYRGAVPIIGGGAGGGLGRGTIPTLGR